MSLKSYSELNMFHTFEDRFRYLALRGRVGDATFGYDRWINQDFYKSSEWRHIRSFVITRDEGCDLGVPGREIHDRIIIHHMNPMMPGDIVEGDEDIINPEYLITTIHQTHNAIHYGDERQLAKPFVPRTRGDTTLWKRGHHV